MTRNGGVTAWLLLVTLGLAAGTPAQAQEEPESADVERAKELYFKSLEYYQQARYDEAVEALQEAYALAARPNLLYNMASPLERLGRWEEALDALKRYRPDAEPEEIDAIDRRIANLELKVAQERADKEALEAAKNQPPPPTKTGPPVAAYALIGTGIVGIGSGTLFTARALSARSDWTGQCVDGDARLCPASASDAVKRDRTSSVIADVSWVLGVGATGAGLAIALGGKKDKGAEAAQVTLAVQPQYVGLTWVPGVRGGGP